METIFTQAMESLMSIPVGVWIIVLIYALSMPIVYIFGIPFKRRFVPVIEKMVSHGINSVLEKVKVYNTWWTEANVITGLGIVGNIASLILVVTQSLVALIPMLFLPSNPESDLLDGKACKRFDCHSNIGAILDPLRDRLAILVVVSALVVELGVILAWFVPLLFVLFFEIEVARIALAARKEEKTLNTHGPGERRQIIHLLAIETILVSMYLLTLSSVALQAIVCTALTAMAIASYRAYSNYRRIYVEHTQDEI